MSPMLHPRLNICSKGSNAIWSGITCKANMPKKIQIAPRKGIHAKAYAAMLANTKGKMAAGMAIANELKCPPRLPLRLPPSACPYWIANLALTLL